MKKITFVFLLFISIFTAKAQLSEGFESGFPPTGWITFIGENGEGTNENWKITTTIFASGSQAAEVKDEDVVNSAEDWLVTPQFTPTSDKYILTFKQRQGYSGDFGTEYTVRVSTASQNAHSDFTIVDTQSEADFNTVYSSHNVDLTDYIGQPIYVAFVMKQDDGDRWFLDDVELIENANPPSCALNPTPSDNATDVALTITKSLTISWEAPTTGDAPTDYEVFWGTTSGNLTSLGSTSSTTVNITNNEYSTDYYWKVVPKNVGGSATGCSEWKLTTQAPPAAPSNDLPNGAITLTIDSGDSCGSNIINDITNNLATDSGITSPSCGEYNGRDLWFKFVAPSNEVTLNTTNLNVITSVGGAYYSGSVGSLVERDCTEFVGGWPWKLTGLTQGETYYLRVWDYLNDQVGSFSLCGYSDATASLDDLLLVGFNSYPNPVSDVLNLEAKANIRSIQIFNVLGKKITTFYPNKKRTVVDVSKLSSGVYTVKVLVADKLGTYKIIKE